MKNCGHDGSVKLLPMLESNGRGNDVGTDDAVWICDSEIDEVEDGASMLDDPGVAVVVAAGELLESSCRACNPIRGFGAGRRSYTSSLSKMLARRAGMSIGRVTLVYTSPSTSIWYPYPKMTQGSD